MTRPFRLPGGDPKATGIVFALPRSTVILIATAVLLNAFATVLIATALVLHISRSIH